ncbi:YegP family protein [Chitinophaga japonensis]|uniref:DUF1508 domain-containing protein n=1 Tax=Chitinophaga japonensis TaxID=104662 RepID=A0A562T4T3_CHIJA|nr:YegP family protein [Chitinophaga japonensis]TWI88066.1 hypothetical protein LX66_2140 [Chitinophaga japonensis]
MNNPTFQLHRSPLNNQFYFRLRGRNGEITLNSESYISQASCRNGIASVKRYAPHDEWYVRRDRTGNYTFNLKAPNGEIIGRSENYTTAGSREQGIQSVKIDAPHAIIEDLT